MPLFRGYSPGTVSANISELMRTSTPRRSKAATVGPGPHRAGGTMGRLSRNKKKRQKQAVAIALRSARESAKRAGVRPRRLFRRGRRRRAQHRSTR